MGRASTSLVYSGLETVSDDRIHLIEDLKRRYAPRPDDFDFLSCNLTTVHLLLSGIGCHYKDGVDTPRTDAENFTLDEATTACACLVQRRDADFPARILVDRKSLWSFDECSTVGDGNWSRYAQVFRPEISARTVWRAVQALRCVIHPMQESGRVSTGTRRAFFENARWLVLNMLFLKLRSEQGESLALSPDEKSAIRARTVDLAGVLVDTV